MWRKSIDAARAGAPTAASATAPARLHAAVGRTAHPGRSVRGLEALHHDLHPVRAPGEQIAGERFGAALGEARAREARADRATGLVVVLPIVDAAGLRD